MNHLAPWWISVFPVNKGTHEPQHPQWHPATWDDYLRYRDATTEQRLRLFFNQGYLFVEDMGWEGINHAKVSDLLIMLLVFWFMQHSEQLAESLGGCLLEKPGQQASCTRLSVVRWRGSASMAAG